MSENNNKDNPEIKITSNEIPYPPFKGRRNSEARGSRLVHKNGKHHVRSSNIPQRRERFLADFFTSFIDAKWRWVVVLYSAGFLFSWCLFGTVYFIIFELRQKYDNGVLCVEKVDSWTSAFLFSVESQTTIGYGGRQITPECPEAIIFLLLQSLTGFMLSTSLLGLIFAKLSRPRPRAQTVMFSKHAVIAKQDGLLSLMFRVGDARKSQLLDVTVSLHCIQFRTTSTGQEILVSQQELSICTEHGIEVGQKIYPFLLLPLTVVHVIDERSPLYELGAQDLKCSRLELVAVLEGVVESTSMVTQARASYLAEEIVWGERFNPISVLRNIERGWKADFSSFDRTHQVRTSTLSAKEQRESKNKEDEKRKESLQISECQVWIPREEDTEFAPEKLEMHSKSNCKAV
ncbi:inward rectifier potassium channel 2-like [Montipora capricornis]|uniref:inward rectifier potassium channel 2-like n=1 Tax=Montipora capricornis TaxID=246305 RepID=UPI0035F1F2A8